MGARTLAFAAVRISQADWDELVAHAREEAPNECCGYLSASDGEVEEVFRAENERHSPYGYELDPRACSRSTSSTTRASRSAIYHSHPRSPAEPSQTDINLADLPALDLPDRLARRRRPGGARVADRRRPGRGGTSSTSR